jgi:hypothetical protein
MAITNIDRETLELLKTRRTRQTERNSWSRIRASFLVQRWQLHHHERHHETANCREGRQRRRDQPRTRIVHETWRPLRPEATTFRDFSGKEYKIVGLNTKRRSNPVIIQPTQGGKQRIAPASYVREAKERQNG